MKFLLKIVQGPNAGAEIVNDISAGRYVSRDDRFALVDERRSEEMAQVVVRKRAAVVIMHMRGAPKTMQTNLRPYDSGVVQETLDFRWAGFSPACRYSCQHSLSYTVQDYLRPPFCPYTMLLYQFIRIPKLR